MDADVRARLEGAILDALANLGAQPAAWGRDDCALWVASILHAALGYDPAAAFRGRYADRNGADVLVGRLGLGFALRAAARRCGWVRIHPDCAQPGDVGLTMIPLPGGGRRPMTMICRGAGWFVGRAERGFVALEARAIKSAWAVV